MLPGRLEPVVKRTNPKLSPVLLQVGMKEVQRIHSPELLSNNEAFQKPAAVPLRR